MLKQRVKETKLVLSKINSEVDTILELKNLEEVQKMNNVVNLVEFFKWKYISRYAWCLVSFCFIGFFYS